MFRASQVYTQGVRAAAAEAGLRPDIRPQIVSTPSGGKGAGGGGKGSSWSNSWAGSAPRQVRPQRIPAQQPWRPQGHQAPVPQRPTQPQTPNTVTLQGPGLQVVGEDLVESTCQRVAIEGGFSVHEVFNVVSNSFAQLEFPHREAAAMFVQATYGQLRVKERSFVVRHPMGGGGQPVQREQSLSSAAATTAAQMAAATDTLVLRQLGQATENEITEEFLKVVPRLKRVKLQKTISGQSKGVCNVTFHEVFEAANALRIFREKGCLIAGRRVVAEYAQAQTLEEQMAQEAVQQQAKASVQDSHAKALSGVNGDMWANYLSMFNQPQEEKKEPEAKRQRLQEEDSDADDGHGVGYDGRGFDRDAEAPLGSASSDARAPLATGFDPMDGGGPSMGVMPQFGAAFPKAPGFIGSPVMPKAPGLVAGGGFLSSNMK